MYLTLQIELRKSLFIKFAFALFALLSVGVFGTNKVEAANFKYLDEMQDKFVEFQPNTKLQIWTSKQCTPDTKRGLMAPLRADNFFYPKEGTTKMKVKFLATNKVGVYQIQLPGNYFYVDDSKPFDRFPDFAYAPEQRYYLLGQRPKYSNLRASWEIIPVAGTKAYRIRNMATGRYLSVNIWNPSELGSPLRLIAKDYKPEDANYIHTFNFVK